MAGNFGREFTWRIGGIESNLPNFPLAKYLQYDVITAYMLLCDIITMWSPPFKMSTQKRQTLNEWNENSPDLVYHQLAPVRFNLIWFEADLAVLTLLTALVCDTVAILV